jgi:hypothetical protein
MLGLYPRPRRPISSWERNRVRPFLERLETRDCPAPVITSFSITATAGKSVRLTGHVQDTNPAADTVTLSGVVSGSVAPNASGDFTLNTTASTLGTANAVAQNGQGQNSASVAAQLSVAEPEINNFKAVCESGTIYTFSGHVADPENPQGLVVRLSGLRDLSNVTATCDANGNFEVTVNLRNGCNGTGCADCTDWWGQAAIEATCPVN